VEEVVIEEAMVVAADVVDDCGAVDDVELVVVDFESDNAYPPAAATITTTTTITAIMVTREIPRFFPKRFPKDNIVLGSIPNYLCIVQKVNIAADCRKNQTRGLVLRSECTIRAMIPATTLFDLVLPDLGVMIQTRDI
jgi:hypothetical protein